MIEVKRYTLSNGLRLVHNYNPGTKIVAVNTLYKVGGKNDLPNKTGYAHLLEHLMFEGSENVSDFDAVLQNAGGENNAYTTSDITNYYDILPAQNIETALWIESDRMVNLKLTEESLTVQRNVVAEEFKQRYLNRPYGDVSALYRSVAYKKHPYRIPVIGKRISHIYNAKLEDIKSYYNKYYAPNNAILSIVGNITFEESVKLVEKWFGGIPRGEDIKDKIEQEPKQRKARAISVDRNVPSDMIYKVYHMPSRYDKDYYCIDMITDILAMGKSSRLRRELEVNRKIFSAVDSCITGDIDPGLVLLIARLNPGITMEEADNALTEEINRVSSTLVSERELQKVKNKFESNFLFENMGVGDLAAQLAYCELLGDASLINDIVDIYRKITAEELMKAAQTYLVSSNSTTLYYNARK